MSDTAAAPEGPVVLRPFVGSVDSRRRRFLRRMVAPSLILFCFFLGLFFAFFAPYLIPPFAVPVAVLAALAVWALPNTRTAPTGWVVGLFFAFFVSLIMWPNYLSLDIRGLPWITLIRLTGIPMVLILLICVSTSKDFRTQTGAALGALPWLWKLLVAFAVIQFLSIGLSHYPLESLQKFFVDQIGWTAMFFAACYVFLKPGRAERWAAILWAMAIGVALIALYEQYKGRVPWADHIPSFLAMDPSVRIILAGGSRAADGQYRLQSTFSSALGLAEYLALAYPFVLHFVVGHYRLIIRLAAAASIPFIFYIILGSGSRLGVVGFILGSLFYLLFWGMLQWRREKRSLFGPAVTLGYPVILFLGIASTFVSGRIRGMVWGNGPQQNSTDARVLQYHVGIPKVLSHPWGHGLAMSGETLGILDPRGSYTIDTYWLSIALDYGVVGFLVFYGMILLSIWYAGRYALAAPPKNREYALLVPIGVAIINFFVIKSTFSEEDNHPLVFMMMGMIVALVYRIRKEGTPATAVTRSPPAAVSPYGEAQPLRSRPSNRPTVAT